MERSRERTASVTSQATNRRRQPTAVAIYRNCFYSDSNCPLLLPSAPACGGGPPLRPGRGGAEYLPAAGEGGPPRLHRGAARPHRGAGAGPQVGVPASHHSTHTGDSGPAWISRREMRRGVGCCFPFAAGRCYGAAPALGRQEELLAQLYIAATLHAASHSPLSVFY